MPAIIDTRKAHQTRRHGELTVILSWAHIPAPEDPYAEQDEKRVMYLVATHRAGTKDTPGAPVYVIREANAHLYATSNGQPTKALEQTAKHAAHVMGFVTDKAWVKVATAILESVHELIAMPSAPPHEYLRGSVGRMILSADGKPIAGEDIRVEKAGVEYA